ncbi:hypothetical protein TNCV_1576541 [Trichonephila clavipes]|nr:hypothetical protein TNCV_1576541 [Trichonephila clavipes]
MTRGRPITGYPLLGPWSIEKCCDHSVETVYRDRNSGPLISPRATIPAQDLYLRLLAKRDRSVHNYLTTRIMQHEYPFHG